MLSWDGRKAGMYCTLGLGAVSMTLSPTLCHGGD